MDIADDHWINEKKLACSFHKNMCIIMGDINKIIIHIYYNFC